ncbi:preprotein translocase subunit SecA, partial [Enterorhabdus sp. P55]|nr:preprotein translocase subunit SecA [Enterorhabdus sp. P55]
MVHNLLTARDASKEAQVIREAGRTGSILITTALAGRGTDIKLLDENAKRLGLFVIGVGRGQSKRVDDQLRGRAGRQGDIGQSIFLVSKEDDLYNVLDNPQLTRSGEIKWSLYTPDYVQKMIEAKDYDSRKNTLEYDDVLREQREVIYHLRNSILENKDLQDVASTARKFAKRAHADAK